jgi:hypothetical protein
VTTAIEQAIAHPGPALIDFRIAQEENVYPMVGPGAALEQMIRRPNGRHPSVAVTPEARKEAEQ